MIAGFLPVALRRLVARMIEFVTPSNRSVRSRWIRRPELHGDEEVCLFVTYAPNNLIADHSIYHARSWADAGFKVVIIIISDNFASAAPTDAVNFATGLLIRDNRGYDFGAWASALLELPELRKASLLALVNDSLFGPFQTFRRMLDRARASDADVIGAMESHQVLRHYQSFLLFFKRTALKSDVFWNFWRNVRAGGRLLAIYRYELELRSAMEKGKLRCIALFGAAHECNPTLSSWRELVNDGFPYVKVAMLRDNPLNVDVAEWAEFLSEHGYDAELARQHLAGRTSWWARQLARRRL